MARLDCFSLENLGISILGHMIVIGSILLISNVVFPEPEKIIAPDRLEITEIDLSQVKVMGDETKLYNTAAPDATTEPKNAKDDVAESKSVKPDDVVETKLESPTLMDAETTPKKEEKKEEKKEIEDKPAPKKKTIVRVNRDVASLDRTLTISVVDALRVAMTRCWTIDTSRSDISGIRAVAHLTLRPNGTVADTWFESAARANSDPGFAYVLETIRDAINVCQPFRMLPAGEYEKWKNIQLNFYPSEGKVM